MHIYSFHFFLLLPLGMVFHFFKGQCDFLYIVKNVHPLYLKSLPFFPQIQQFLFLRIAQLHKLLIFCSDFLEFLLEISDSLRSLPLLLLDVHSFLCGHFRQIFEHIFKFLQSFIHSDVCFQLLLFIQGADLQSFKIFL